MACRCSQDNNSIFIKAQKSFLAWSAPLMIGLLPAPIRGPFCFDPDPHGSNPLCSFPLRWWHSFVIFVALHPVISEQLSSVIVHSCTFFIVACQTVTFRDGSHLCSLSWLISGDTWYVFVDWINLSTYTENEIFFWENGKPSRKELAVCSLLCPNVPFHLFLLLRSIGTDTQCDELRCDEKGPVEDRLLMWLSQDRWLFIVEQRLHLDQPLGAFNLFCHFYSCPVWLYFWGLSLTLSLELSWEIGCSQSPVRLQEICWDSPVLGGNLVLRNLWVRSQLGTSSVWTADILATSPLPPSCPLLLHQIRTIPESTNTDLHCHT